VRTPGQASSPHLHLLVSEAARAPDGTGRALPGWDAPLLMSLFRDRLLARLLASHAISQELVSKLLAWRHPGFSTHLDEAIASEEKRTYSGAPGTQYAASGKAAADSGGSPRGRARRRLGRAGRVGMTERAARSLPAPAPGECATREVAAETWR